MKRRLVVSIDRVIEGCYECVYGAYYDKGEVTFCNHPDCTNQVYSLVSIGFFKACPLKEVPE